MTRRIASQWYGYTALDAADAARAQWSPDDEQIRELVARKIAREPGFYGEGEQAITKEAIRMCGIYNQQLKHNLSQADVDAMLDEGQLHRLTHRFVPGEGWVDNQGPKPTADEVNRWSLEGFGHDGQWSVARARCARAGVSANCPHCHGEGECWASARTRARFQKWTRVEPPEGIGYQLWESVTEGSPISPVFEQPEDLARWLEAHATGLDKGTTFDKWMRFIEGPGWAPSVVVTPNGVMTGVQAVS
jgi:hypothetical protein